MRGVLLPEPFRTNSLAETPAEVPPRTLDVAACYRDAGIDLAVTLGGEDVPVDEAGPDGLWTDEELHAAMATHFSAFENEPQWRLYLLLANRYVEPGVLGIMFDSGDEAPRQGAAVFAHHSAIANAPEADRNREYLCTIVHELGHAAAHRGIPAAGGGRRASQERRPRSWRRERRVIRSWRLPSASGTGSSTSPGPTRCRRSIASPTGGVWPPTSGVSGC